MAVVELTHDLPLPELRILPDGSSPNGHRTIAEAICFAAQGKFHSVFERHLPPLVPCNLNGVSSPSGGPSGRHFFQALKNFHHHGAPNSDATASTGDAGRPRGRVSRRDET